MNKDVFGLYMSISSLRPSHQRPSEKLVAFTPKNKDKKVRFADPVTSSSNTQKQVDSHKPNDSNQPLLHSTGVIGSTGASGSKPTGNTKNNRISQSSSSNKTNKVEDQSRSVKSRKNKKNHVAKTECNAYVMQYMLNANSKYVCAICNECLFDENHDKCVLDYVLDVNMLFKSRPTKHKHKKFTSTTVVPLKETTIKSVLTPTQGIKVYSRRAKAIKSIDSSSKSKIIKSRISNKSKPNQIRESTASNVPSSSLIDYKLSKLFCGNDHIAKIMGYGDYQIGNVTISKVYYVEGHRHNLFFVGQFCNSDFEVAFRKHTCFVRNLKGVDLVTGSRETNFYTFSIGDMMKFSPICLLSKASKTKSSL
ncbi:hypothetical protein Tco_0526127 [Tanacetum coccineum]